MTAAAFEQLVEELDQIIIDGINNQPRSLQKRIGPSEMGTPCDLRIGYKLLDQPPVNVEDRVAWKPWIGTQVHDGLGCLFELANAKFPPRPNGDYRFLVEWKLDICQINGDDVDGNCDLYADANVIDWKIVGGEQLRKYKKNGPGDQYRTQAHLYGYGWAQKGYPVDRVAVYFLPRDQEFRQRYCWSEPYDEQVALDAITRVDGIARLAAALGPAALPLLKTGDAYCRFCPWFRPGSTDLAGGCAGHPDALPAPDTTLESLIA